MDRDRRTGLFRGGGCAARPRPGHVPRVASGVLWPPSGIRTGRGVNLSGSGAPPAAAFMADSRFLGGRRFPAFVWDKHLAVFAPSWHRPFLCVLVLLDAASRTGRSAGHSARAAVSAHAGGTTRCIAVLATAHALLVVWRRSLSPCAVRCRPRAFADPDRGDISRPVLDPPVGGLSFTLRCRAGVSELSMGRAAHRNHIAHGLSCAVEAVVVPCRHRSASPRPLAALVAAVPADASLRPQQTHQR
jgi:hypothetical protein